MDQSNKACPVTLAEAVTHVLPRFEGIDEYYPLRDEDNFVAFCRSRFSGNIGLQIRNELKLFIHDSPLHQYFLSEHNLFHPDAMTVLILRGVYQVLTETKTGKAIDKSPLARDILAVFRKHYPNSENAAFAISFTLPPDYREVHWVTNVSREDGIKLFRETALKMIANSN